MNDIIRKQMRLRLDHLFFSLACQSWSCGHSFCPRRRSRRNQPDNPTGYASTSTSSSTRVEPTPTNREHFYYLLLCCIEDIQPIWAFAYSSERDRHKDYYNLAKSNTETLIKRKISSSRKPLNFYLSNTVFFIGRLLISQ